MKYLFGFLESLIKLFGKLAELFGAIFDVSFKFYFWFVFFLSGYASIVTLIKGDYIMTLFFMFSGLGIGLFYFKFLKYAGVSL